MDITKQNLIKLAKNMGACKGAISWLKSTRSAAQAVVDLTEAYNKCLGVRGHVSVWPQDNGGGRGSKKAAFARFALEKLRYQLTDRSFDTRKVTGAGLRHVSIGEVFDALSKVVV